MTTQKIKAVEAAPQITNAAEAEVAALLKTNQAAIDSFNEVTKSEAAAYKQFMQDLKYSTTDNSQILNYIKVKLIRLN